MTLIIPNSKFVTEKVTNWTHNDNISRIYVKVGVSYDSDINLVEKLLIEVAKNMEDVLEDMRSSVSFNEFGDSSLNFELFVWVNNPQKHRIIKSKLNFAIFHIFKKIILKYLFHKEIYI